MHETLDTQLHFEAAPEDVGLRMDKWLATQPIELTRSQLQKLCEDGFVKVGEQVVGKNYKLRAGDTVLVSVPAPKEADAQPQDIPLDIVFEDDEMLVVNKPKGMVVHPAPGHADGTLVNALLHHCRGNLSGIGGVMRPGIVHRIDKDTSGLLMVAKTDFAHLSLSAQIKEHSFFRQYHAVVYGNVKTESGSVNAPIGRHPSDRKKMCVTTKNAREAITHYEVLERFRGFSHLRITLETGRTHQIRVHMTYMGHPVAGDPVYGPSKILTSLQGQCLHAATLGFERPKTGEHLEFTSPLPDYFTQFLGKLPPQN